MVNITILSIEEMAGHYRRGGKSKYDISSADHVFPTVQCVKCYSWAWIADIDVFA